MNAIRNLIVAIAFAIATAFGIAGVSTPAFAQPAPIVVAQVATDCGPANTACVAANRAAARPEYTGPIATTTERMLCFHVTAHGVTELVLYDGPYRPIRGMQGEDVILSWRPQPSHWSIYAAQPDLVIRQICIQEAYLAGRTTVTLCNGTVPGEGFHVTFSREDLDYLRRVGGIGQDDPAALMSLAEAERRGLYP